MQLTFTSNPGLELEVGGRSSTTPFSRTVIRGSTNSISAPSQQFLGSAAWAFSSWSDGGARTHDIVAPDSSATYTASYLRDSGQPVPGLVAAYGFDEPTRRSPPRTRSPPSRTGGARGCGGA